jgi:hypothetical protein
MTLTRLSIMASGLAINLHFNFLELTSFWSKLGTTPSAEKGPAPASSSTTPGVSKGQLSGLIGRYKTKTDDGAFGSFLSEFEGLLK